jgi:hypothetical protein
MRAQTGQGASPVRRSRQPAGTVHAAGGRAEMRRLRGISLLTSKGLCGASGGERSVRVVPD